MTELAFENEDHQQDEVKAEVPQRRGRILNVQIRIEDDADISELVANADKLGKVIGLNISPDYGYEY